MQFHLLTQQVDQPTNVTIVEFKRPGRDDYNSKDNPFDQVYDYIDLMESTPKLHSKKCKIMAFILKIFLQYTTFIIALISWYLYDYFIAIAILLLTFIIMGIVRSKIRNSVIPLKQREYQYNDKDIADWFIAKEFCYSTTITDD